MSTLLKQEFAEAAKLPEARQDLVVSWLLAELASEDEFDRTIARTSSKLIGMARDALVEHVSGLTAELDSQRCPD